MLSGLREVTPVVKLTVLELLLLTFVPVLYGTKIAYYTFESKPRKAVRTCGYSFVITSFVYAKRSYTCLVVNPSNAAVADTEFPRPQTKSVVAKHLRS